MKKDKGEVKTDNSCGHFNIEPLQISLLIKSG